MAGVELSYQDKIDYAKLIDKAGVYQIEAGTPAMGGDEKKSIEKLMSLGLKSRISAWNRMSIEDINHSMDCSVDIIHIAVPVSDIQMKLKLGKDRAWLIDQMKRCLYYALDKGYEVVVGLEDSSRADFSFLLAICSEAKMLGVSRIRYADTVGILHPGSIIPQIRELRSKCDLEVEFHGHNDFGMAVANSIAAHMAGAEYVDTTFGGIGERAGNCDYVQFIRAVDSPINHSQVLSASTDENVLTPIFRAI